MFSSLRVKVLGGFGLVLLVVAIMATVSLLSLFNLSDSASRTATKSIPVSLGHATVKEEILLARNELASYLNDRDEECAEKASDHLNLARQALGELEQLAETWDNAELLKEAGDIRSQIGAIEQNAERVRSLTAALGESRRRMDAAASVLVRTTDNMLELQSSTLQQAIEAKAAPSELARIRDLMEESAHLIGAVGRMRVANFKGQADRDIVIVQNALSIFDEIQNSCDRIAEQTQLDSIGTAIAEVRKNAARYDGAGRVCSDRIDR